MTRDLPGWARPGGRARAWLTLPGDLAALLRRRGRPRGAPEPSVQAESAGRRLRSWRPRPIRLRSRVRVDVFGAEAILGLEPPVVVAANEASRGDARLLRSVLPAEWRIASRDAGSALAAGRSALVFAASEPTPAGRHRPRPLAAELAKAHRVPIVPVAVSGTPELKALLRLRGQRFKPDVAIRFGAPIYSQDASIRSLTRAVDEALAGLLGEIEPTWWESLTRAPSPRDPGISRWRLIWQRAEVAERRRADRGRIWP